MSVLEINGLNVYYGNIHAIKDVSLKVEEGEIVSLIGANGAGKTTTLQTISGIIRPKSGSILFNGKDITKERAHNIVKMGIAQVPEGRRVFSQLSVSDNVRLGAFTVKDTVEGLKENRKRFYDIFPRMRERKQQLAGTLSGGEQQMLAMGRAIMSRPKLLILDEPSLGLAPIIVDEVFHILKQMKEQGTSMLIIEQNLMKALSVADRGYVMETGQMVLEGSSQELLQDPMVLKAYLGVS